LRLHPAWNLFVSHGVLLQVVLLLFSEAGVEAVFDHLHFLAVVVSNWRRLVGLFESGPSVVGHENWRFVVDHLLLYAFHLATAIFVLALVLRDPWTRLDRYVDAELAGNVSPILDTDFISF
jgi:hypothetical protein